MFRQGRTNGERDTGLLAFLAALRACERARTLVMFFSAVGFLSLGCAVFGGGMLFIIFLCAYHNPQEKSVNYFNKLIRLFVCRKKRVSLFYFSHPLLLLWFCAIGWVVGVVGGEGLRKELVFIILMLCDKGVHIPHTSESPSVMVAKEAQKDG